VCHPLILVFRKKWDPYPEIVAVSLTVKINALFELINPESQKMFFGSKKFEKFAKSFSVFPNC
jgi:hypothetical protein